jgi:uncharacterized protein with PIN domain
LPAELVFFLDRQLGRHKMAGVLRAAGLEVEIHDAHFRQDAKDEEWLRAVGEKQWIVITRDERIRIGKQRNKPYFGARYALSFSPLRVIFEQRCLRRIS